MSNPRYNPLPTPANVLFSGYLNIWKLSGWNRMAKKRWIVINLETLQLFRDKDDNKLAGSISLIDCTVNDLPMENGEYRFEVLNPPDSHIFSSNNAKDVDDAMKAIKKGIDQRDNAVFGQRLSKVIRRQSIVSPNNPIPNIVLKSVNFIRSKGLDEEGLFRLPGNTNKVKELKKQFDEAAGTDYIIPEDTDIHTVSSLLKLYLRELPESLIPSDNYEICAIAIDTYETNKFKGINQIIQVLQQIPSVNYDLIKFLMKFLNDVQEYSSMNKMDIDNLSTVFGPNMLSVNFQDPEVLMKSTKMLADITKVLIRHYHDIFVISATKPAGSDQTRESTTSDDIYQELEVASSQLTQSYNTASTEITMLEKEKSKLKGQVDKLINQMETMKVEYEDKLKDLRKLLETEKNSTRVLQIKLKYERRARLAEEDRNAQLQIDLDRLCNMLEE